MSNPDRHPIYARDASVYLESGADKFVALELALEASGFLPHVEAFYAASGKPREQFLIAIKPDFMTASKKLDPNPVYTDPELVESLVDRLLARGFHNLAVVDARNEYDYAYQGRSVRAVAEMVGYTARSYRLEDLSEQKIPYDYGGVLGQHVVGRTWRDADYRISFAKNKTDWRCFYAGCLMNVYGCLPEWDRLRHYHGQGREFNEACLLVADRFPVHFGFLDAWVSGDGFSGPVREARPKLTRTIFASENIYALDWVMGEKMEINPALNSVIQEAMFRWGTINITRRGNLTTWYPWENLRPLVVFVLGALASSGRPSRFLSGLFAPLAVKSTAGPKAPKERLELQKSI